MKPITRRTALASAVATACGAVAYLWPGSRRPERHAPAADPEAVLMELKEGNARYVNSHRVLSVDTAHDAEHRHELVGGQHPIAAVLTCSDSRLCPEFIFDQREGGLFDIRNAGNLVDDDVMATLEYAVEHLHVRFILVLGHKGCGAVRAVCEAHGRPLPDHLRAFQDHMRRLRDEIQRHPGPPDPATVDALARANARQQAEELLQESDPIRHRVAGHTVRLMYGLYDMESGAVEFFDLRS